MTVRGWLLGPLVALASSGPAWPQSAPYVDRVLEAGPQQEDGSEDDRTYDSSGWPRSLRLEYGISSLRGTGSSFNQSLGAGGFLDTPDWGALSLNASLSRDRIDRPGPGEVQTRQLTWRLDQRAMPLEGGWLAHHHAGHVSSLVVPLGRGLGRLFLPTSPIAGVGGHWQRADGIDLNLAAGRVGFYSGLDVGGFQSQRGQLASGGAQATFALPGVPGRWDAGVQWIRAEDLPEGALAGGLSAGSAWSSLAWEGQAPWSSVLEGSGLQPMATRIGGLRVQANLMRSSSSPGGTAQGVWIDAGWRTGSLQNLVGIYTFDPGLRWGPSMLASDLRGAYWRAETSSRQWQVGWSLEVDSALTGRTPDSVFANLSARYRLDTRNTFGATMAVRQGHGEARSAQASWDSRTLAGQLQLRANILKSLHSTSTFIGADHAFSLTMPSILALSLGWNRTAFPSGDALSGWTWGVLAAYSPWSGLAFSGNLRGANGARGHSLNAAIGATWDLRPGWSLTLRYTEARGVDPMSPQVVSALTEALQAPLVPVIPTRSVQLLLRHEQRAGTATAPLGGRPGAGAGRLGGTVYFDADDNGRRDAAEGGAGNIVVVLDGRFVARTDAQGFYEFPAVVAGEHRLEVQPDNVPLPWSPAAREPVGVVVTVRGTATVDFALRREP